MTDKETRLIFELSLRKISEQKFFRLYPARIDNIVSYVLDQLEKAYVEKRSNDVCFSLILGFYFKTFIPSYAEILTKLLKEEWHYGHGDIASILMNLKFPGSVDALYATALKQFDYLGYANSFSLGRKCILALKAINTEEAWEKIRLLAQSDIPIIRGKAGKQCK